MKVSVVVKVGAAGQTFGEFNAEVEISCCYSTHLFLKVSSDEAYCIFRLHTQGSGCEASFVFKALAARQVLLPKLWLQG